MLTINRIKEFCSNGKPTGIGGYKSIFLEKTVIYIRPSEAKKIDYKELVMPKAFYDFNNKDDMAALEADLVKMGML